MLSVVDRVLAVVPVVMATMMSSRSSRALVVVLLLAVLAVNCHQHHTVEHRPDSLDLLEPATRALALATRRQQAEHLPARDRRTWRKNRVRVWGKRTTHDDEDDDDDDKRSWHKDTVRVWGKRQGAAAADRRSWAGNTIRVWGKRLGVGLTPQQVLDVARYNAAPKRSIDHSDARVSRLSDDTQRASTALKATSDFGVGTLADNELTASRSKRSLGYHHGGPGYHHGGRWVPPRWSWVPPRRSMGGASCRQSPSSLVGIQRTQEKLENQCHQSLGKACFITVRAPLADYCRLLNDASNKGEVLYSRSVV